jgi:mannose/fructose/N-acetylgalactosamine-specific phosphotransferase system component IIB
VEDNRIFLTNLVVSNSNVRQKLLKTASEEEIKTIFELLYNINSFPFSVKETRILTKHKRKLRSF